MGQCLIPACEAWQRWSGAPEPIRGMQGQTEMAQGSVGPDSNARSLAEAVQAPEPTCRAWGRQCGVPKPWSWCEEPSRGGARSWSHIPECKTGWRRCRVWDPRPCLIILITCLDRASNTHNQLWKFADSPHKKNPCNVSCLVHSHQPRIYCFQILYWHYPVPWKTTQFDVVSDSRWSGASVKAATLSRSGDKMISECRHAIKAYQEAMFTRMESSKPIRRCASSYLHWQDTKERWRV